MTNKQHPITPPFELMNQWYKKACKDPYNGGKFIMAPVLKDISNSAAQWGADQELEACCEWLRKDGYIAILPPRLRAARRPKPPSLKEEALRELGDIYSDEKIDGHAYNTIRQALEALPND